MITREQLHQRTQSAYAAHGGSLRSFARTLGLATAAHLCAWLRHGTAPAPRLLRALGYEKVEAYRKIPRSSA